MNNLAGVHGISNMNPKQVLEKFIENHKRGIGIQSTEQYLTHVHNIDTGHDSYGIIFAAGHGVMQLLEDYYSSKTPGSKDVAKILSKIIFSKDYRDEFGTKLEATGIYDNMHLGGDHLLIVTSVIPRITKGLDIFHHMPDTEKIHLMGSSLGIGQFSKYLIPAAMSGFCEYIGLSGIAQKVRPEDSNSFYDKSASELIILSETDIPYTIDSERELPTAKRLRVTADKKIMVGRF